MWANRQKTTNLLIFAKEFFNGILQIFVLYKMWVSNKISMINLRGNEFKLAENFHKNDYGLSYSAIIINLLVLTFY